MHVIRRCYARRNRSGEHGAVAVVVASFSVVMFTFAAMVVDLGMVRDQRVQLQTAADAAALAATAKIYASGSALPDIKGAVDEARTYASSNAGVTAAEWASCSDPSRPAGYTVPSAAAAANTTPCISFWPDLDRPQGVRVVLPIRNSRSAFAGIVGVTPPAVRASAEADVRINRPAPCALCVVGAGLHDTGNGKIQLGGGGASFNGDLRIGPNGIWAGGSSISVEHSVTNPANAHSPLTYPAPPITDPLESYPLPSSSSAYGPPSLTAKSTSPCREQGGTGPGIYGSYAFPSGSTCTLDAGLYVIAGGTAPTWKLSGNASTVLKGTGVTLLFTCGTPTAPGCPSQASGASFEVSGDASLQLSAPQYGPLAGFTVIFSRNNTATLDIAGNARMAITGSLYMPRGTLMMRGNGCFDAYSILLVTGDLKFNGENSCLNMTYDATRAAQLQPDRLRLWK